MRRRLLLACALAPLAAPAAAPADGPGTGGTPVPSSDGGVSYGQPLKPQRKERRGRSGLLATQFSATPATLTAGTPARFTFRVDGRMPQVRVRIVLARDGAPAPAKRLRLGYRRTGVRHTYSWTPAAGELPAGQYAVTLHAFDDAGRALRRTARASGRGKLTVEVAPVPVPAGRFPVQGAYSLGGEGSRFGAERAGHVHLGQDITAAEGTPLVGPMAGVVSFVDFQAKGAGHYVVLRGVDGRDYVFMHLKAGSVTVRKGAELAAGEPFAQVGSTGGSSGPHLHFEIWPDGWYSSKSSRPIDPLPLLLEWAGTR